mgnify:FL=1
MIYCIGIYIWLMIASYYPSHDFDQNKWKENKEIRYEYTDDIIDNKLLIGKTKREVIDMLGNEAHDISSDIWYYYVGYVPGIFGIDPDYLVVEFKDDKVVNVYQYTS